MSAFERESIAKCLFNKALAGHAQWDEMAEPHKDDWRAKADAWMLDVNNLMKQRAELASALTSQDYRSET
jgi:hypothetical protein